MTAQEFTPGIVALMGSGETAYHGGQIFENVARRLNGALRVRVLETPAGFELNSALVAGRVAEYLKVRLQNYRPQVEVVAARARNSRFSPDNPEVLSGLTNATMIFLGPGSPSYTARQLCGSLAWQMLLARHRLGAALVMASAATVAMGVKTLPVYEIYKVGEDPHWKNGLDLLGAYGIRAVVVPHWNNNEGGADVDTSRCFIGRARFEALASELDAETTIIGLDEHSGLIIDLAAGVCEVAGQDAVHVIRQGIERSYTRGDQFPIDQLGAFHPLTDPAAGLDAALWAQMLAAHAALESMAAIPAPAEVLALVEKRQAARLERNWAESDALREQIAGLGWKIQDTPQGPVLEADSGIAAGS